MEFVLESVNSVGVRCGKLILKNGIVLETPMCLTYTRGGAVPHVTQEVLHHAFATCGRGQPALQMNTHHLTLPSMFEHPGTQVLHKFNGSIHKFANCEGSFVFLSVQDPAFPPPAGYNERKLTSIWTSSGRKKVSVQGYMDFVSATQPDAFEALCDTPPPSVSQAKRVRKSVDRTLLFLDETLAFLQQSKQNSEVFGVVEGCDIVSERKRSARETAQRPVAGFVIEGFNQEVNKGARKDLLLAATNELPQDKVRLAPGFTAPEDVFEALEAGVDVFDGSLPYVAAEKGLALHFCGTDDWQTISDGMLAEPPPAGGHVDVNSPNCADQLSPIVPDCFCYTCQHHTLSYVHHLLKTKELLADVLLMIHNMFQYMTFFGRLRFSLKGNNYGRFKHSVSRPPHCGVMADSLVTGGHSEVVSRQRSTDRK